MDFPFDTLIFDFDLTLADSREAAFDCINFALAELGHKFRRFIAVELGQVEPAFVERVADKIGALVDKHPHQAGLQGFGFNV